jgi:hypothetical protein
MCVSLQRETRFASKPSLSLRKTAILTRAKNGVSAWMENKFHTCMLGLHYFACVMYFEALKHEMLNCARFVAISEFENLTAQTARVA